MLEFLQIHREAFIMCAEINTCFRLIFRRLLTKPTWFFVQKFPAENFEKLVAYRDQIKAAGIEALSYVIVFVVFPKIFNVD